LCNGLGPIGATGWPAINIGREIEELAERRRLRSGGFSSRGRRIDELFEENLLVTRGRRRQRKAEEHKDLDGKQKKQKKQKK